MSLKEAVALKSQAEQCRNRAKELEERAVQSVERHYGLVRGETVVIVNDRGNRREALFVRVERWWAKSFPPRISVRYRTESGWHASIHAVWAEWEIAEQTAPETGTQP